MIDAQTGHEKTMTMMLAAMAGANMIYGLGMIDLGMTLDPAQLVIDNDIAKMVRRMLRGIPVDDVTMATDVIRSVGAGGHFLMEDHTLKNMRANQSKPSIFDRSPYANWERAGKRSVEEKAIEESRRILKTHKAKPLPKDIGDKLHDIVLGVAESHGIDVKTIIDYMEPGDAS